MQYLLNERNGDVVPENAELSKMVDHGFKRISHEEAMRHFGVIAAIVDAIQAFDKAVEPQPDSPHVVAFNAAKAEIEAFDGDNAKDELEQYARDSFSIELDKRKSLPKLKKELIESVKETFGL